ncbi:MAG: hypothetical protein ABR962_04875 [Candidatus Bathyarchaeia archaeon]
METKKREPTLYNTHARNLRQRKTTQPQPRPPTPNPPRTANGTNRRPTPPPSRALNVTDATNSNNDPCLSRTFLYFPILILPFPDESRRIQTNRDESRRGPRLAQGRNLKRNLKQAFQNQPHHTFTTETSNRPC